MNQVDVKELIQAGVHFGHKASRWHPRMKPYIFGKRNQIHIIDLRETVRGILRSSHFLARLVATGRDVVFVGTKRPAKTVVEKEAQRCGMHWVSERWLGGTLTNYHTIRERLKRLEELEELERSGDIERYSKKRVSSIRRERRKIHRNLSGIRLMKSLPGCLIVVDLRKEHIVVAEARKIGIPVIALVDTNNDPSLADICIPCNDDAYRSIQSILRHLADAVISGRDKAEFERQAAEKAALEEKEAAEKALAAKKAMAGGDEAETPPQAVPAETQGKAPAVGAT